MENHEAAKHTETQQKVFTFPLSPSPRLEIHFSSLCLLTAPFSMSLHLDTSWGHAEGGRN